MTANLPKRVGPFDDDLIRRIAMDIGKQVVAHIDHAYPEMFRAVAAKSARLSIRNATFNAIMAAMTAADEGRSEERIRQHENHRKTMRRLQRQAGSYRE